MGTYDWGELAKQAPKGFEPVPANTYTVECIAAEQKTYNSGNQGLNVDVAIAEGPYKGRKIRYNTIVFNPENPSTFFSNLRGFGIGPEFFADMVISDDDPQELTEALEEVAEELVGKVASTKVTQEKYEGRVNNKCGFFNPVKSGGTTRRRRSSTPDVDESGGEDEQQASEPAASEETAPRRSRSRRARGGEPGLPPGL